MKILFVMRSTVYVRNFESMLRLAVARGHAVHVVADPHTLLDPTDLIGRLAREYSPITHGASPERTPEGWSLLGQALRRGVDYLRYLGAEYSDAPKLRARAERAAPEFVKALAKWPVFRSARGRQRLARWLRRCDHALPRDRAIDAVVDQQAPDVLLVTPLVEPGSPQAEYVRSARSRGIRTGLCVYSWDNLTNKGLIQEPLDVVTVWNEPMRQEAITLHGVAPERVVVTGAPAYDHWFDWRPTRPRAAFCAEVGLPDDRRYLLYLCSSKFIAPDEVPFVRRWIESLRGSTGTLRDVGVLVRPHPQHGSQWKDVHFRDLGAVAIWPTAGRNPVDIDSRSEYYDSIHHSAGVVGVNTSAQIESAIVRRRVYTILAPEFRDTQDGTLHFRHLCEAGGGLLRVAKDFPEHLTQLEHDMHRSADDDDRAEAFLKTFVRPFGLTEAAAPRLLDAIERLPSTPAIPVDPPPAWAWLARRALRRTAAAYEREERDRQHAAERKERERRQRAEAASAKRQARSAAAQQTQREKHERAMRREASRQAAVAAQAREDERRQCDATRAFQNYLMVRDRLIHLKDRNEARTVLEQPTLAPLAHIWNATPEVIAQLRHHVEPISGVSPARYDGSPEARKQFFLDLNRLLKVGNPRLIVAEPQLLGGFGYLADQPAGPALYNDDTLKYYEVMSALECAAVLRAFEPSGPRKVVWEIGGGWGGFAYQFKTLFPNVTYVITAPPELLMFSAVYLLTAFPEARYRFEQDTNGKSFWDELELVDFAFATQPLVDVVPAHAAIDLTLDLQALERMSVDRVDSHVSAAFQLGSRYFYSLGPADALGTGDLTPVANAIAKLFWSYEMPVPQYEGMKVLAGFRGAGPADGIDRMHRFGWKRVRT